MLTEENRRTTEGGLQGRIPEPDYRCVREPRRDPDSGTYTIHLPQNPAGHWTEFFGIPNRISRCGGQLCVKVGLAADKQSKNPPTELGRCCLGDSCLQYRSFRTVDQAPKK